MSIETSALYTITAPSGVDGYGEIAQLNGLWSDTNFVGWLEDLSFGLEVRSSIERRVEQHGGKFGSFYYGEFPFTATIVLARASTFIASNARYEKLNAATDAMASDGSIVWTEAGRVATRILFRRQQSLRGPDAQGKVQFAGVAAESLILSNATVSGAPGSGLTNSGKHATFPTVTFTSPASGTVVISRTSPSPTESLTLNVGGTAGLAASTATTVDFGARTVYQGSTRKNSAIAWPASIWWAMAPGANTISVSAGTSQLVTWRYAWLP